MTESWFLVLSYGFELGVFSFEISLYVAGFFRFTRRQPCKPIALFPEGAAALPLFKPV